MKRLHGIPTPRQQTPRCLFARVLVSTKANENKEEVQEAKWEREVPDTLRRRASTAKIKAEKAEEAPRHPNTKTTDTQMPIWASAGFN